MTPRARRILRAVRDQLVAAGRAPTIQDLATWVGCSPSTAARDLHSLAAQGYLQQEGQDDGRGRRWRPLGPDTGTGCMWCGAPAIMTRYQPDLDSRLPACRRCATMPADYQAPLVPTRTP